LCLGVHTQIKGFKLRRSHQVSHTHTKVRVQIWTPAPSDPHTQLSAISLYRMILAPSWFTYSVRYSPTSEKNRGDVTSAQYSSPYARVHRVSSLIVITVVKYHRNRIYVQAFHRLKCESKRDWMSKAESSRFKAT